ncbi:uncharacterized protein [Nicotiana sylvestris]|uniref:uncharacterized protein n=1 Tax=Nicotiana sylvestris TaxID=4096 RepID=UPI00388C58AF
MSAPWPFVAWGMDIIGPIELAASNGHRFLLIAIDYFTKWVEAKTFKSVTKKAVVDFVHSSIIYRFEIPKVIIMDNGANLNSKLMEEKDQEGRIAVRDLAVKDQSEGQNNLFDQFKAVGRSKEWQRENRLRQECHDEPPRF